MATGEYQFRPFDEAADLAEYMALYNTVFGQPYTPARFAHRHKNAYHHGKPPLIYVAIAADGSMAGSIAYMPLNVVDGTTPHMVVEAGDVMVSPDHRRKGLFTQLIEYSSAQLAAAEVSLILGFPNPAAYPGWCRMGFSVAEIYQRVCVVSVANLLARKKPMLAGLGRVVDVALRCLPPYGAVDVVAKTTCGDSVTGEFTSGCYVDAVRQIKDEAYLRWRFDDKPNGTYECVQVRHDGVLVGVAIIALREDGLRAEIADYFVQDVRHYRTLLRGVVRHYARHRTVGYVTFRRLNTHPAQDAAAKRTGFWRARKPSHIITHALRPEGTALLALDRWHLSGSEMDTI